MSEYGWRLYYPSSSSLTGAILLETSAACIFDDPNWLSALPGARPEVNVVAELSSAGQIIFSLPLRVFYHKVYGVMITTVDHTFVDYHLMPKSIVNITKPDVLVERLFKILNKTFPKMVLLLERIAIPFDLKEYIPLRRNSLIYRVSPENLPESSSKRSRKRRGLSKKYELKFYCISEINAKYIEKTLKLYIDYKKSILKSNNKKIPWFLEDQFTGRFISFLNQINAMGFLCIHELRSKDEVIGVHIGYQYCGVTYYILPAYDLRYKNISPGRILVKEILDFEVREKGYTLCFGYGDESYKSLVGRPTFHLLSFVHSCGIRGYLFKLYFACSNVVRNFLRK